MSRSCGEGRCVSGGGWPCMTQNGGLGAIAPISTLIVWSRGRVSKFVTASLANASARSLPRMCLCVCPDFSKDCGVAFFPACLKEV